MFFTKEMVNYVFDVDKYYHFAIKILVMRNDKGPNLIVDLTNLNLHLR
jgi:hypothetical protein